MHLDNTTGVFIIVSRLTCTGIRALDPQLGGDDNRNLARRTAERNQTIVVRAVAAEIVNVTTDTHLVDHDLAVPRDRPQRWRIDTSRTIPHREGTVLAILVLPVRTTFSTAEHLARFF